ncbi:hypothetical protein MRX96_039898 [Rhipicephalus microplus]
MTQKSGAPRRAAAAIPKEPGKMPSGGGCSEQCKKKTREFKASVKKMKKVMEELQTAWRRRSSPSNTNEASSTNNETPLESFKSGERGTKPTTTRR